jgi:spore germination cell wall hydrolase CwlJ-like protein
MMLELAAICLSLNIYYEARNQPLRGQMAVAEVVLNRVEDDNFPSTVCEVVMECPTYSWKPDFPIRNKCQFSWYCDGKSDTPTELLAWDTSVVVAENILANVPPKLLDGATHYHSTNVNPFWAKDKVFVKRIGDHLFYK